MKDAPRLTCGGDFRELYFIAMGEAPDCVAAIMFGEFLLNNNTLRGPFN